MAAPAAVPGSLMDRGDEISILARALSDSATALWGRMDAIERFAADVSHEIKNPLTSIRSAIETLRRVEDAAKRRNLLAIMTEDVMRLDRLITDISDASPRRCRDFALRAGTAGYRRHARRARGH